MIWIQAFLCLAAINALTFLAFGFDKRKAETGGWRVPERSLLTLALLGGWPSAKAAQRHFRHKTRKEPFRTRLNAVPVIWAGLGGLAVYFA